MKITMTESQAAKVRQLITQDSVLDQELAGVHEKLTDGLKRVASSPMLTAAELEAAVDVLEGWLAGIVGGSIILPEYAVQVKAAVKAAIPKLKALGSRQAAIEEQARG